MGRAGTFLRALRSQRGGRPGRGSIDARGRTPSDSRGRVAQSLGVGAWRAQRVGRGGDRYRGRFAVVEIRPFRGLRYDPARVDPDAVLAPPYDVVSATELDALLARSPYNARTTASG